MKLCAAGCSIGCLVATSFGLVHSKIRLRSVPIGLQIASSVWWWCVRPNELASGL